MFILDTNVLSALMGSQPVRQVALWIAARPEDDLFTTTVCQAEVLAGIEILAEGRRRNALEAAAHAIFAEDFDRRILPFDPRAAGMYAELFAARKRAGRPAATADLMIAAIARTHGACVVTRDTGGFEDCGLTLVNPWENRDG